ncbi:3H domain-containing protein [Halanaerobaculum tunisiense]
MSGSERRKKLLERLQATDQPITGSDFAIEFSVSRQVIVQDVALLRAQGEEILATSRGYLIEDSKNELAQMTIACQHDDTPLTIKQELEIIIQYGGRIKDVTVEHSIYGELKGVLMIQSQSDIESFIADYESGQALCSLTEGVHLHTIEALNQEVLNLIKNKLCVKEYLLIQD